MISHKRSPFNVGTLSARWVFAVAALSPLPLCFLIRAALDPMFRTWFHGPDGWIASLELWGPYLILAGAACRRGLSRVAFGLLIGGLIAAWVLFGIMASSGDGGAVTQGGLNSGLYLVLVLGWQYLFAISSVLAGLGVDWFLGVRGRPTNANAEPSDAAESR